MASETPLPVRPDEHTQFAVLLFTDICDSTALKARHGALEYKKVAELHNRLFEELAVEEEITPIKHTGDGYLARGMSVAAVVRFALRFQHGMRVMVWPGFALATRVGVHAGEVADITTLGQTDVLAPAADLAARVMGLGVGGQILLTRWPFDEARHFVRAHPAVESGEAPALSWLAHGPYLFKGCEDPVEVFEVGATESAPLIAPPDGEKAKRAIRAGEEETLGWRPACGLEVPGRTGWVLARKIGEGGFGEVWLAEQAKIGQRRVFKFCFDEERLRSFKRELTFFRLIRDALGERADIARLYDVKLDAPPFFLESEFAEQGNLVEWCEKQGGVSAVPLTRRLELMAQIAEAVAAAHSVGILHKDLKPQNVLMQERPGGEDGPQITDFGIGALADKAALAAHGITAAGFTVNTLKSSGSSMTRLYAPPEQLTGKAFTVQGDVYALGVMLWQFVIGDFTRALAPGWEREVKDELLREDLAKCLDGEPSHRLASATELAQRLRTLERRRTALAEQQALVRAKEQAAYRRGIMRTAAVAVAVVLALLAGIAISLWQAARATRQTKRAVAAEALAVARLNQATIEKNRADDEAAIAKAVTEFLQYDLLAQAASSAQAVKGTTPNPNLTVREALDRAAENIGDRFRDRPLVEAAIQDTIGRSYDQLSQRDRGIVYLRRAVKLRSELLGAEHPDTLASRSHLGGALAHLGKFAEAEKEDRAVLDVRERVLGAEHRYTLSSRNNLAIALKGQGKRAEAEAENRAVLAIQERVLGAEDPSTLTSRRNLAVVLADEGKYAEAEKEYRAALSTSEHVLGAEDPSVLWCCHNLARCLEREGKLKEALEYMQRAETGNMKVLGPEHRDSKSAKTGRERIEAALEEEAPTAMAKLADSYAAAGRLAEAFPLWAEASAHLRKDTILVLKIATLQAWFGKGADHTATSRRMLELAAGTDDASTAERAARAYCARPSSDPQLIESAVTLARHAVELGKDHPYLLWYQMALGMAEYRHDNYPAADQALRATETAEKADRHVQGITRFFRAMSLFRQGKEAEARQLFAEAEAQMEPLPADENQPLANGANANNVTVWLAYKEAKALLKSNIKDVPAKQPAKP